MGSVVGGVCVLKDTAACPPLRWKRLPRASTAACSRQPRMAAAASSEMSFRN
nr:hypothetical protein [Xanthomonas sp. NCPPB 1128]